MGRNELRYLPSEAIKITKNDNIRRTQIINCRQELNIPMKKTQLKPSVLYFDIKVNLPYYLKK